MFGLMNKIVYIVECLYCQVTGQALVVCVWVGVCVCVCVCVCVRARACVCVCVVDMYQCSCDSLCKFGELFIYTGQHA